MVRMVAWLLCSMVLSASVIGCGGDDEESSRIGKIYSFVFRAPSDCSVCAGLKSQNVPGQPTMCDETASFDTMTDASNCGSCANVCPPDSLVCFQGSCKATCRAGSNSDSGEVSFTEVEVDTEDFTWIDGERTISGRWDGDRVTGTAELGINACSQDAEHAVTYEATCVNSTQCQGTWQAPGALTGDAFDPSAFQGELFMESKTPSGGSGSSGGTAVCPDSAPLDCGTGCCEIGTYCCTVNGALGCCY